MLVLAHMEAASSSTLGILHQRKMFRLLLLQVFSLSHRNCLEVKTGSEDPDLRTLARGHMQTLTGGTRRHIILNSLMWLKCVLHLQILHPPRYLLLQCLISLEFTPIHHLIRLCLLLCRHIHLLLVIYLYWETTMTRYPLSLLALRMCILLSVSSCCHLHRASFVHMNIGWIFKSLVSRHSRWLNCSLIFTYVLRSCRNFLNHGTWESLLIFFSFLLANNCFSVEWVVVW